MKVVTLFMLDPSYLHINHGGCGATPRYIIEKQKHLVNQMEQLPDRWFKKIAPTKIRAAASDLASFIGAEPNEVVFVVNATTGINSVIRSLDLQQGDSVLCLDLTYRPVLNTLRFVCEQREELYQFRCLIKKLQCKCGCCLCNFVALNWVCFSPLNS